MPPDSIEADWSRARSSRRVRERARAARRSSESATKYQVFVSSTFRDLVEERQAVSRAILELNHIPAGMELFPAFDEDQLDFIKKVIDDCDYYLIILGGKYGSVTDEGISFTEAEYNYAVEAEKPVIALINNNIDDLPSKNVEKDPDLIQKLQGFRERLSESRLVKYWSDINDLRSNAIISLTTSFDQSPQVGWRRDSGQPSKEFLARYEALRDRLESVERGFRKTRAKLLEYEDIKTAEVDVPYRIGGGASLVSISSDDLIREFAAALKNGFDKQAVKERLESYFRHRLELEDAEIVGDAVENVLLFFEVFEIVEAHDGIYVIAPEKIGLLKAAFRKRGAASASHGDMDEEIPF